MKKTFIFTILGFLFVLFTSSCHKDHPTSTVTLQNYTPTALTVSLNGTTTTIPANSTASFVGSAGSALSGQALSPGGVPGTQLSWSLNGYNFPPSGTTVIPLDASTDYFYLIVKNNSTKSVVQVDVNTNNTDHTTDITTVPNDGYTYGVGYYYADANSNVILTLSDNSTVSWPSLNLPGTLDQTFNASFP